MSKRYPIVLLATIILIVVLSLVSEPQKLGMTTGLEWTRYWESRLEVTTSRSSENVTVPILFGYYKPANCSSGAAVYAASNPINFTAINETYESGLCTEAVLSFANIIYSPIPTFRIIPQPPTPANGSVVNNSWVLINISTGEPANLVLLVVSANNLTYSLPMAGIGTYWWYNLTDLGEGEVSVQVFANNSYVVASDPFVWTINPSAEAGPSVEPPQPEQPPAIMYTIFYGPKPLNITRVGFRSPTPDNNAVLAANALPIAVETDSPANLAVLELSVANRTDVFPMAGTETMWWINLTELSPGSYSYRALAQDTLGNVVPSETRTAEVRTAVNKTVKNETIKVTKEEKAGKKAQKLKKIKNKGFDWEGDGPPKARFEDSFGAGGGTEAEIAPNLTVQWRLNSVDVQGKAISTMRNAKALVDDSITYQNILDAVNLSYEVSPGLVKERITLANMIGGGNNVSFIFGLNLTPGLGIETENGPYSGGDVITGGPVYFVENGARLASFTKPYAVDAAGSRIDLVYELSEKRGSQAIATIVSGAWLADPQRVYPITIDPTLSSSTFNVTEVVALAGGRSSIASPEYNMTLNFGEPSIGQSANSTPSPATGFIAQLGFFYTAYDITPPLIGNPTLSVSSPTKQNNNIQVNSTWSDNLAVSSCDVILSGATSGTYAMTLYNSTVGYSSGTASKTISLVNDGTTNFQVHCHDTSGNIGTSTTTSLTVDSTPPTVTFVSPTPPNSATFNNRTITINTTATDTANSISGCTLEFGGTNESMNMIGSGTSVVCTKTKVSATDGTFTYKVFADDALGNTGVSESRTITFSTSLVVFNVSIEDDVTTPLDQIDLVANGTRTIYGTATVNSGVGIADFNGITPTSRFRYTTDTTVECGNNNNNCYVNSSCVYTDVVNDTTQRLECAFTLQYNAVNSAGLKWEFNVTAKDTSNRAASGTDTTDINKLLAIEIPTSIDFGAMMPGVTSGEKNLTVTNYGNVQLDLLMNGTDMGCSVTGAIPMGSLHYNCTDYGQTYDQMTALTATLSDSSIPCSGFDLSKSTDATGPPTALSKPVSWRLKIPVGTRGTCSGTVLLVAIAG